VVTHDEGLMEYADRVLRIRDGRVVRDERRDATAAPAARA
jgi:ABC-type lipoprotein export system ATPase subunit